MHATAEIACVVVALTGAVAVFIIGRRALQELSSLGNPTILAACTAALAFFGLLSLGPWVLIPFGLLACVCLLLPLLPHRLPTIPLPSWTAVSRRQSADNQVSAPATTPTHVPEWRPASSPAKPSEVVLQDAIIPLEIERSRKSRKRKTH
jgi:hypothetical protein